jgi:PLP dependent protein
MGEVAENFERIRERVEAAAHRSGRSPDSIRIMAVTKNQPRERVVEAYEAGIRLFGENRIGEAEEKYTGFHHDAELHMIGHLQRNKASRVVGLVRCVESIDKIETARAIDRRCRSERATLEIMIEVNTSGEASKSGYTDRDQMIRDLEEMTSLRGLKIVGLMTIAPFIDDPMAVRAAFASLRAERDRLADRFPMIELRELSMGMTGDFEIAIEEGSTLVRIGTALFGRRDAP